MYIPLPGTSRAEIDTPALLIDLDLMDRNITLLFDRARGSGVTVRPHLKTGKTPAIAHRLLHAGAQGICVSKLGEAEVMAAAGIEDILITTEVAGAAKIARLMGLLRRHPDVKVVVDSIAGIEALATAAAEWEVTAPVLVEIDVGQHRSGTGPGQPAVALAEHIASAGSLRFLGVQGYEGQLQHIHDPQEREQLCAVAMEQLTATVGAMRTGNLPPTIVTTGGTGTWQYCAKYSSAGVTEVQPGSFIFMDVDYRNAIGTDYTTALTVQATVISCPTPSRAIIDAGLKALSTDSGNPEAKGLTGVTYRPGGDEHGILTWDEGANPDLKVGDTVELIPSHCDTTINLFDDYFALRSGRLEAVWSIEGRGKSQ
ncbi:MAG: DSD1 family PLP-dependent enzyme [Ktedonobacterales bacterium]